MLLIRGAVCVLCGALMAYGAWADLIPQADGFLRHVGYVGAGFWFSCGVVELWRAARIVRRRTPAA
jgi:hypothetical protein